MNTLDIATAVAIGALILAILAAVITLTVYLTRLLTKIDLAIASNARNTEALEAIAEIAGRALQTAGETADALDQHVVEEEESSMVITKALQTMSAEILKQGRANRRSRATAKRERRELVTDAIAEHLTQSH